MSVQSERDIARSALVVGCGYVGSKLFGFLQNAGWQVEGIRRKKSADAHIHSADVFESFAVNGQYNIVFYLISADRYDPESYKKAYVTGVANTIEALKKLKLAPRFIFVSSTSLFSENGGGSVDETSPVEKSGFSKKSLFEGEALVADSGFSYSIVRFSGIYGPGRQRLIDEVRSQNARLKIQPCISNRIHVDDCVGVLSHLADLETLAQLYIASDCEPTPYNNVLQWLSLQLGVPKPPVDDKPAGTAHMSNKKCLNSRLLATGYQFKYPSFREGFKSCF